MDLANLLLLLLLMFASTINAQFPATYCGSTGNFTANSTYQNTLTFLLSTISTASDLSLSYGFFNNSAPIVGSSKTLYVYGLCRGDLTAGNCRACLIDLDSNMSRLCPLQKEALLYTRNCIIRYSDAPFFSSVATEPSYVARTSDDVSSPDTYGTSMRKLLNGLRDEAAGGGVLRKYASGNESAGPDFIYALVQCTSDLTKQQCSDCLGLGVQVIMDCCVRYTGGRFMVPSCLILYETNNRFMNSVSEPLAPPRPPSLPSPEGDVRPPPPGISYKVGKSNKPTVITIAIAVPIGGIMVLLFLTGLWLRRKGKKTYEVIKAINGTNELTTMESLQFDLATMQSATNDFSPEKKLGEGGFGEVFQGRLPNGQEIAVKRLSRSSRQGDEEFKNEVLLVAKFQHRNLVRLLGFCLEGAEKLLAYEFVPNKSLDHFLFDLEKRRQLDWPMRYKIISGIARGMLYLHEDSRLRIIHRDLKCSNILLDNEMNPKISDFGMARIFGINQNQASTNKIVGTFGYMSPEYTMHGEFSVKSDVYSFGILLLEIICGKKNNFYPQLDGGEYLATYVWNQWRDNRPLEVLDPTIEDSYSRDEVLRCLHMCLLCIQEDPAIRPTMATVVLMLSSNSINLPLPQHPAFFIQRSLQGQRVPMEELELEQSTRRTMPLSTNDMSITELDPR
ncbi:cysteine-rich receptor-like protein kinase 10 [Eucalyptus grandis]|uniref:cysteine-rich receptor-like protein kinase 10 n=1 Tax=Eucalyptus grandis TaxID=71139 RepID=UPI00192EBFA9|nr:cysteine-rich receptor-like protein kinase 10 [Eucalyptus grandis]